MTIKYRIIIILIFVLPALASAQKQEQIAPKIKVILLGTFHFGSTSDRHKTAFPDLFTQKRQQELEKLATLLAKQHPDKIFIESEPNLQPKVDSLYLLYRQNKLTDSTWLRNEIVQLGFRIGVKTDSKASLVCADHKQELPYAAMQQYEKDHQQDSNPPFFNTPYPFSNNGLLKLNEIDLRTYILQINTTQSRQRSMYDYLHYSLLYGKGDDYTGVEMSTAWYSRNFKILTNIFRAIGPADKCILVIMGSAHTAVLHELLIDHPRFEIVELNMIL